MRRRISVAQHTRAGVTSDTQAYRARPVLPSMAPLTRFRHLRLAAAGSDGTLPLSRGTTKEPLRRPV